MRSRETTDQKPIHRRCRAAENSQSKKKKRITQLLLPLPFPSSLCEFSAGSASAVNWLSRDYFDEGNCDQAAKRFGVDGEANIHFVPAVEDLSSRRTNCVLNDHLFDEVGIDSPFF